jgi:hypothetical protein
MPYSSKAGCVGSIPANSNALKRAFFSPSRLKEGPFFYYIIYYVGFSQVTAFVATRPVFLATLTVTEHVAAK